MSWKPIKCPDHDDSHASASVTPDGWLHCHACGANRQLEGEEQEMAKIAVVAPEQTDTGRPRPLSKRAAQNLEAAVNQYHADGLKDAGLLGYLHSRGLDREDAIRFQLGVVRNPIAGHDKYMGRMSIPYLTPNGPVSIRFRCMCGECKAIGHPKYMGLPGQTTRMYGVQSIADQHAQSITITEGEIDALTLMKIGIPAVGIPGAQSWKKHYAKVLEDFQVIKVVGDGDAAGREFMTVVSTAVREATPIQMPEGMDTNSVYVTRGEQELLSMIGEK